MTNLIPARFKLIFFYAVFLLLLMACMTLPITEETTATPSIKMISSKSPANNKSTESIKTPTRIYQSRQIEITETAPVSNLACKKPSDNYNLVEINGHQLNQRTYEMLQTAKHLYAGTIEITGAGITQGSFTTTVEASFNTHAGGGAVDLSVMSPGTYTILYEDITPLIQALRLAGFAAWFRDLDELYDGSPAHIHAIAIGDRTLSLAAREQLAGPFGYFWGYNGLPQKDKMPIRDPHSGPILCDWMIEKGYPNKTATPSEEGNPP